MTATTLNDMPGMLAELSAPRGLLCLRRVPYIGYRYLHDLRFNVRQEEISSQVGRSAVSTLTSGAAV